MIIPTFDKEIKLRKNGYKFIAGIDEVGRGPLAGPVVACAAIVLWIEPNAKCQKPKAYKNIRDSKQLSPHQREKFYKILTNDSQVHYGIGIVSEKIIDKINILQATFLAMKKAIENLPACPVGRPVCPAYRTSRRTGRKIKPDFLLIDGKWTLENYPVSQTAIPQGDKNIFSIAVASIIAKVTRDRMLVKLRQKYPQYGFEKHKGYGTKLHLEALKKYGPCEIHRKSFKPVKNNF